ncbi:hypothetical protein M6B38_271105 [Iris pallida]|uniref:Ribosomal protein S14 n=1 Tax=Iris pallida TaxID=29817 RepID=A0AAX6GCG9_IRIPA|nr:hypothetical protein M6B38_373420 [Iris pallida]KAJ6849133.1 hypothetical protein M6B38_271105 [Iris pallida]
MLSRAMYRTKSKQRVTLSQRMHRVESMRSAALSRRISALNRLEDSKKSNRPMRKSESMHVLILVGFMYRPYIYAEILEVDILSYSRRVRKTKSPPRNELRLGHGKPNWT